MFINVVYWLSTCFLFKFQTVAGNATSSCSCPNECQQISFTSTISYSALSDFSSTDVNKISSRYLQNFTNTVEIYNRLDDDTMNNTIQSLESLIYSHQMLVSTLSRMFLNPKSSITNSIYQALNTISSIIRSSSEDTQQLLQPYLDCYENSMDYIMRTLRAQIDLTRQNMFSQLQLISVNYLNDNNSYINIPFLKDSLTQIEPMLNSMNFSQEQLYKLSYPKCPNITFGNSGSCSSNFTITTDRLNETGLLLQEILANNESTTTFESQFADPYFERLASLSNETQLSMSLLDDCLTQYPMLTDEFSNFLSNDIFSTDLAQSDTNLNLMNTVNEDIDWLINLTKSYIAGKISKQSLSQQFLSVVDNKLFLDVTSVVNAVDQTILFDVNNQIAKMEDNLVSDYLKLLNYLLRMEHYFPSDGYDSTVFEKTARRFSIWRKPIYQRDNPTVSLVRPRREFVS